MYFEWLWSFWARCRLTSVLKQGCHLKIIEHREKGYTLSYQVVSNRTTEQRTSGKYILVFGKKFLHRFLPFKNWSENIYVLPSFTVTQEKCYNYINQKVKQRRSIQLSEGMTQMRTEKKRNIKMLWNISSICGFYNSNPFLWLKGYMIVWEAFFHEQICFQIIHHTVKKKMKQMFFWKYNPP